jgi:DNA-binding transcriptional MerR regulator/methylmalonyl-CoA mutase cobalamin-binding subunit
VAVTGERGSLRIGELARRTDASPELLRAWEQRYGLLHPSRSPGGFRLYSEGDVRRVLRMKELMTGGMAAAQAASAALAGSAPGGADAPIPETLAARLEASLDAFDGGAAHRVLDELVAAISVEAALDDVIVPYLRRLGARWSEGRVSVAQEHFASALIRGRLMGFARGWGEGGGPRVLLACPPGEEHDLPLIVFGIVIAHQGWRVTLLGADTPFETIEAAVETIDPSLVVLGTSTRGRLSPFHDAVRRLASRVPVAVGGPIPPGDLALLGAVGLEGGPVAAARATPLRSGQRGR